MAKYAFPAVFTPEEGGISVHFPDVEGCFTSGETIDEALYMAADALALMLYDREEEGLPIPTPSPIDAIIPSGSAFTSYIRCDTVEYRRLFHSKAVKKTLTLPAWLNTLAEREGINFSAILQTALKEQLHLN